MNIHTVVQKQWEELIKDNDRINSDTNETLQNGDASTGIGLLKRHTLPKDKKSSKANEINMSVDNGDVNGDYCYRNSYTGSAIWNQNLFAYKKKRDEISTKKY